ncbi:iron-containing redox enzyme family protein [Nonomuraea sp. NPDC050786]|uniref:iron-containing redox enzyme family protein n=1 Tax=Nonomuraea sp. NPDC050786 TaxID=3154840 RepID=UPI0033DB6F13
MTVDQSQFPSDELCAHRVLYVRASDPEEILLSNAMVDDLAQAIHGQGHAGEAHGEPVAELDHILRRAREWADAERECYRLIAESPRFADTQSSIVSRIALNSAPMALVSGAWLQWLVSSGNGDSELSTLVLGMYATDVGVGHPRSDRGSRYSDLLQDLGLASRAVPESRLAAEPQTLDCAFELPSVMLAMSRCGEEFLAELLGADVCLRWMGLLPPLGFLRNSLHIEARWDSIDLGRQTRDTSLTIARTFIAANGGEAARLLHGAQWALARVQEWSNELRTDVENALDPAFEMAEMLRLRARQAAVYHDDFLLDGKSLRDWFLDARDGGAEGFMAALAASRLVKPGQPDGSRLLGSLVDAAGPMFRIFSPEDVGVIRRWIASLGKDNGQSAGSSPGAGRSTTLETDGGESIGTDVSRTTPPGLAAARRVIVDDEVPATIRLAYHRLLRRGDSPELRRYALTYVSDWLDRSRAGIERVRKPPRTWQPGSLRKWLLDQHDEQDELFQAFGDLEAPARDLVIDTYVQMAPLNLIDGSWLSGFTDYRQASSDFGHFLFATYFDELGNGERRLNHPLIYRELMREMGFDLPPTASLEFADWPGFRDESFELPVYWLSINRFPRRFLPETLGLNLAMELSGVGGTYRRERFNVRAHGFSSEYFDIHNTIDNVATGHSAWAADAIEIYLAGLCTRLGAEAAEKSWERIRVGFRSLHPPLPRPGAEDRCSAKT